MPIDSNDNNIFDFAFTGRGGIHYSLPVSGNHILRPYCELDLVKQQREESAEIGVDIPDSAIIWQIHSWAGWDSITWHPTTAEILLEDGYVKQAMLA